MTIDDGHNLRKQLGCKVCLILQDTNVNRDGAVYDCLGYPPLDIDNLDKLECVGYWDKLPDGTITVYLINTIEAREDVLVSSLKETRKNRIEQFGDVGVYARYPTGVDTSGVSERRVTRASKPRQPTEPEVDISAQFSSLKSKLLRRK